MGIKSKAWLQEKYWAEGLTLEEIGQLVGRSVTTIHRWMCRRSIPRRAKGGSKPGERRNKDWPKSGEEHPSWKGGHSQRGGYAIVHKPNHPHAHWDGYVQEHRIVMEEHLSRYLLPEEVVHHINGDSLDNRIENLRLCASQGEHIALHNRQGIKEGSGDGNTEG